MSLSNIELIIKTGVEIAQRDGVASVTASNVARSAGITRQTVHNNFVSSNAMRTAVFIECIKRRLYPVIAELIITKHPIAATIPASVRTDALNACK